MKQGYMIVCDGSNGAGKTTIIKAIKNHLEAQGREIMVTREPGGTAIGEKIREIVLSPDRPEMSAITELLLFSAARAQHIKEKIVPALQSGKIVISDRFDAAMISFQHYARGLSLELTHQLNNIALDGFKPDIYIILDLDPVVGLSRVNSRGEGLDRLESEKIEFLKRARNGYLEQAHNDPKRFVVLDASQPLEEVIFEVIQLVDNRLV